MTLINRQNYVPGYSESRKKFQSGRRADLHASFMLSHIKANSRILDCGCGAGSITNDFAALASDGQVYGIDIAKSQVHAAQDAAHALRLTNVSYSVQNLLTLDENPAFGAESFDVVYAHAVLEHLADPFAAIGQIKRVLKPGGIIAVCDAEWRRISYAPHSLAAERVMSLYQDRIQSSGGDPHVCERFDELLDRAGFANLHLSAFQEVHKDFSAMATSVCEAVERNVQDQETSQLCFGFRDWATRPSSVITEIWSCALGYKP